MSSEQEIIRFGIELGFTPKQLAGLRVKFGSDEALLRRLHRWAAWKGAREAPRLLHRDSSRGYTHDPHQAMRSDPGEAPDELAQKRITELSRRQEQDEKIAAAGELLAAMEDLRGAIDELAEDRKRRMSRTLWQLRSRLDSAEREMRRRFVA